MKRWRRLLEKMDLHQAGYANIWFPILYRTPATLQVLIEEYCERKKDTLVLNALLAYPLASSYVRYELVEIGLQFFFFNS
ncbi:hypothetical protein RchiOBHm_Chr2g0157751 [Rosa chinensis]|uniref:Uncharacterized protein n=1 Tax=Rosa chinensis TaxID=74649 RepID=A0A2P6S1T7_ROSCH|nr:hypothetical protein RchiOBHm_Chr2g0157751 [Rosa chinensis]